MRFAFCVLDPLRLCVLRFEHLGMPKKAIFAFEHFAKLVSKRPIGNFAICAHVCPSVRPKIISGTNQIWGLLKLFFSPTITATVT